MKAQIFINRHIIASNKKASNETNSLVDNAAITVKTYKGSYLCKTIDFGAGARLVQDAQDPICSGATIWFEVDDVSTLIIDGLPANQVLDYLKKDLNLIA